MEAKYTNKAGSKVTAAQYISEILIIREADNRKVILPHRFWMLDEYKKKYQIKIIQVSKYLKTYNPDDVVMALISDEGKRIYSIKYPGLESLIKKQEKVRSDWKKKPIKEYTISEGEHRGSHKNKKDILSKLRELDG